MLVSFASIFDKDFSSEVHLEIYLTSANFSPLVNP